MAFTQPFASSRNLKHGIELMPSFQTYPNLNLQSIKIPTRSCRWLVFCLKKGPSLHRIEPESDYFVPDFIRPILLSFESANILLCRIDENISEQCYAKPVFDDGMRNWALCRHIWRKIQIAQVCQVGLGTVNKEARKTLQMVICGSYGNWKSRQTSHESKDIFGICSIFA